VKVMRRGLQPEYWRRKRFQIGGRSNKKDCAETGSRTVLALCGSNLQRMRTAALSIDGLLLKRFRYEVRAIETPCIIISQSPSLVSSPARVFYLP